MGCAWPVVPGDNKVILSPAAFYSWSSWEASSIPVCHDDSTVRTLGTGF